MAMTYANVDGRVTYQGNDIGIRARVTATPMSTSSALLFPSENRLTWGPQTAETNSSGTVADLKVPTNHGLDELYWRIDIEPLDRVPGLPAKWTMGTFEITADVRLEDLVQVDVTTVTGDLLVTVAELLADTEAARDDAQAAQTAAAGSATAAGTSATAAAGSATAAASSATAAAGSATAAAGSATSASGSATTATTKATEAAASADHAEDMAGAAEAVAVSNDTIIASRINDGASLTAAAVSASIEETGHGLFFAIGSHAARVAPSGGTDTTAIQAALTAGKTAIILDPDRAYAAGALTLSADTVFIGHGTVLTLSATVDSDGHALSFVGVQVVRDEDENATDGPAKNHYVRGGLFVRNDRESVSAVLDVAGFQGQGGSTPDTRTFQVHHYCDTDAVWIDNVGSGTNLVLNLSQNSTRRGDLASDYVGTGFWQKLQRHDNGTDAYLNYLQFDYDAANDEARILWPRGRGHLLVNKSDDGGWAYVLDLTNEHANVLTIPGVFRILSDVSKTRTQIASDSGQTNGLYIKSGAGPLTLEAASGVLNFNTQPKWNSASLESTGSGSASLGSNCPATTATAPYKWLKFASSDGSTVYVPAWK